MTTPQPSSQLPGRSRSELDAGFAKFKEGLPKATQLPEEVKRAIRDCLMPLPFSGEAEIHPTVRESMCARILTALTPYLAPRPPAPMDAEWAKRAAAAIMALNYPTGDAVDNVASIILRHAPADSASAQLAAAQSEVGRLTKEVEAQKYGVQLNWNRFAKEQKEHDAARAQLATLRRERDDWQAKFTDLNKSLMAELRDPCGTIWEHAEALQKERDELRADKERLDWLEDGGCEVLCHKPADDDTDQRPVFWVRGYLDGTPRSLRAALDSARATQGEAPPIREVTISVD